MHAKIKEGWGMERRMRIPEEQRRDSQGPVAATSRQKRACETGVKPLVLKTLRAYYFSGPGASLSRLLFWKEWSPNMILPLSLKC